MSNARTEFVAGSVIIAFGSVTAYLGSTYTIGSVTEMGPGFFPTALGIVLCLLGVLIILSRKRQSADQHVGVHNFALPDPRGAISLVGAVIAFILIGEYVGMMPAMFACVLIAALGSRNMRSHRALLLALGLTGFVVLLFAYLLNVPLQLWSAGD